MQKAISGLNSCLHSEAFKVNIRSMQLHSFFQQQKLQRQNDVEVNIDMFNGYDIWLGLSV